ncbi:MAG: exo-alpha-sialidase [Hydrogenophilaceae bacterium]|nr:exo-alpha-sialidase [Hydrogenophilaceae bacterium]
MPLCLSALLSLPVAAQWQFDAPIALAAAKAGVFHHLDASGRKAIAVADGRVAIAWEDNRNGTPTCHVALRPDSAAGFREFSFGQGECFEPALTALDHGRFALIWEDAAGMNAALLTERGISATLNLAAQGSQGTLAYLPGRGLFAAWSGRDGRWQRIYRARLTVAGQPTLADAAQPADPALPADDQIYPALAVAGGGIALAWEDRRLGHTVIFGSRSDDGTDWTPPLRVSQNPSGSSSGLGRGSGAMRPALAAFGARLAAVWLDKRDFLSGYDVYAALSDDGGQHFGPNLKVQDSFGDSIAQWHAAAAGNDRGDLVIAWDDERDGNADIWLSWRTTDGFADNLSPPPAHGPGSQSDPVITLDDKGTLHLAWIERNAEGHSRLRYARGKPTR